MKRRKYAWHGPLKERLRKLFAAQRKRRIAERHKANIVTLALQRDRTKTWPTPKAPQNMEEQ